MDQDKVKKLVDSALLENDSLFLIELSFLANNKIKVVIDGDQGVPLSECVRVSRAVEHNLDREEDDFSLEVTTPDITQPLTNKRQYFKNIGRTLKVKTEGEKLEGILTEVKEDTISLHWKTREPKPLGKGKVTVEKEATVNFKDIIEAKVKIIF